MEAKDIFKMEMYKNFRDKPYLIMIAILTALSAIVSVIGAFLLETNLFWERDPFLELLFVIFLVLLWFTLVGGGIFYLLYPFRLLSIDYQNKVMSLKFASGVSRINYYFIKIGATMLSCFIVAAIISFIPMMTFLVIMQDYFVDFVTYFIYEAFTSWYIIPFILSAILGLIQALIVLMASVIITKGKIVGIFLFIAFSFGISIVHSIITTPLWIIHDMNYAFQLWAGMVLSLITIALFILIGIHVLKNQDL